MPAPVSLNALLERGDPAELRAALERTLTALHCIDVQHMFERWSIRWFRIIAALPLAMAMWMLALLVGPSANALAALAFVSNLGAAVYILWRAERRWHRWSVMRMNVRNAALQLHTALQQQENADGTGPRQV